MESFTFAGLTTDIECSNINPVSYWDKRLDIFNQVKSSKELYQDMDDMTREAIADRIKSAIEVMHDNVDAWLPSSFEIKSGNAITVTYNIVMTNIEKEVAEDVMLTSFKLREASDELKDILIEMDED
jgi:ribonuclease I